MKEIEIFNEIINIRESSAIESTKFVGNLTNEVIGKHLKKEGLE